MKAFPLLLETMPERSVCPPFLIPLLPPADDPLLTPQDAEQLLDNPASWLYRVSLRQPFVIREYPLKEAHPLLLELLVNLALLSFQVEARVVTPVCAVGRVVLVDYTPRLAPDPPVPLLSLFDLPRRALAMHNAAIRLLLKEGDASALPPALRLVLRDGAGGGMRLTEAFFYATKMLSLMTRQLLEGERL